MIKSNSIVPQYTLFCNLLSERQAKGYKGEIEAAILLGQRGWTVVPYPDWDAKFDLLICELSLPVEVKTAHPQIYKDGRGRQSIRWKFDATRLANNVDHLVMLLVCTTLPNMISIENIIPYLVPSWVLIGRGTASPSVTSQPDKYRGWLAPFRESWGIISSIVVNKQRLTDGQLSLF
jgi:hypothetical protein